MATKKMLEQTLVQLRRIEEHRETEAEKEIRRLYQELLKDLKQFIGFEYAELAEDGKLTYEILQQKGEYARFLEEAETRIGSISPAVSKEIKGLIEDTYAACYTGMSNAVNKASDTQELHNELQGLHSATPETIKSVTEKGLVDEVLKKNWQENVYEIKRNIAVGLTNGDRVETMARRLSKTLDTNYSKAINITRTESHRAREAGFHDSAKSIDSTLKQGATALRLVKTWHTMKDSRVRPNVRYKTKSGWKTKRNQSSANHQKMEGVMILADEYFDLGGGIKTLAPGQSGDAKNDCNCRCYLSYDLMTAEEFVKNGGKLPENDKRAFTNQGNSGIIKTDKQFGKKVGKHAADWGLNAASAEDRRKMEQIIDDIYLHHDTPVRVGTWRGQVDEVLFYIKEENVVITKQDGEFVTILKGGKSSGRVKNARKR